LIIFGTLAASGVWMHYDFFVDYWEPGRPEVPGDLEAVVLRCLAKDPAERFADAESLDLALAGCQTAGHWTEKQAADWWRSQASPRGTAGEE
jgi:hypothetical protein